jgi:dephospho-CoA kinase
VEIRQRKSAGNSIIAKKMRGFGYAMMHPMLHAGLTGNIASGKSTASKVFAELGAHIIDADVIAHDLLKPETGTFKKVVENFGGEIVNPDGTIDRRKLGEIVFHDADKRKLLNSIVHPDVRTEVFRQIVELEKKSAGGIVLVDAALMVESGLYKLYDKLIVVFCHPALQLARLISRDGLSIPEARARMAAQMPVEEKLQVADYKIETSGTFRRTREQIEAVYRDLVLLELSMHD